MSIHLHQAANDDQPQDYEANKRHDRKYGWSREMRKEYTNIARNPEYDMACPDSWLANAKDEEEAREIIWNWHNRFRLNPELKLI